MTRSALRLLALLLTFVVAIGTFTLIKDQGWLTPFGISSESQDSQIIQAIERTQEVSLLGLAIQGIREENDSAEVFGQSVPGSARTLFVQYNFQAKLGLDGAEVEVTRTDDNRYLVSVPEFTFIGYDNLTFKVATEDGGVLSFVTPEIDEAEVVTEVLNDDARDTYIADNKDLLETQTETFYGSLITSIDPAAETTFEFGS